MPDETKDQVQTVEETKLVVLQKIADYCSNSKDLPPDLDAFAAHLQTGGGLAIEQILGGMTNVAFKVFLSEKPEIAVFAKVSYPYPLWHPQKAKFDTERVDNEARMMVWFAELTSDKNPSPITAIPHFIEHFPGGAKLLVTEWAKTDEPFSNQFLEGHVDPRIIKNVAEALALLNLQPADLHWNGGVREVMLSIAPFMKLKFSKLIGDAEEKTADPAIVLCKNIGEDGFERILNGFCKEMRETRETLVHGDAHLLNVLVEPKSGSHFGATGDFVLVDWELTMCGPAGKDVGIFLSLPIVAAFAHAVRGSEDAAYHILQCCKDFWEHYSAFTVEQGSKDELYLRKAFKQSLGAAGFYMFFAFYMLGKLPNNLGFEGITNPVTIKATKSAIGAVGLSFLSISYGGDAPELNLEGLRSMFSKLICLQIESLLELQRKQCHSSYNRRCSQEFDQALQGIPSSEEHRS